MLTIVITAVIVTAAVAVLVVGRGRIRDRGGRGLKHRFGPEYDRAIGDHDGDTKAAERELGEHVKQHGSLTEQPLSPQTRAQYAAQWADLREQFVDSPKKAVTQADALLAGLAKDRGFPSEPFEEQLAAVIEARSLFEALVTEQPADSDPRRPQSPDVQDHAPWVLNRRHAKGSSR